MVGTRARHSVASQEGFALMEVIVSAAVLVIVVLGVLAGLDAATSTAGANKARTVAATLAEKDQERLRGMRIPDIDKMNLQPYDVKVGPVTYHVDSKAVWVVDASGQELGCTLNKAQASYMRITSTVTLADHRQQGQAGRHQQHRGPAGRRLVLRLTGRAGQGRRRATDPRRERQRRRAEVRRSGDHERPRLRGLRRADGGHVRRDARQARLRRQGRSGQPEQRRLGHGRHDEHDRVRL